jgi:hypothetical protein
VGGGFRDAHGDRGLHVVAFQRAPDRVRPALPRPDGFLVGRGQSFGQPVRPAVEHPVRRAAGVADQPAPVDLRVHLGFVVPAQQELDHVDRRRWTTRGERGQHPAQQRPVEWDDLVRRGDRGERGLQLGEQHPPPVPLGEPRRRDPVRVGVRTADRLPADGRHADDVVRPRRQVDVRQVRLPVQHRTQDGEQVVARALARDPAEFPQLGQRVRRVDGQQAHEQVRQLGPAARALLRRALRQLQPPRAHDRELGIALRQPRQHAQHAHPRGVVAVRARPQDVHVVLRPPAPRRGHERQAVPRHGQARLRQHVAEGLPALRRHVRALGEHGEDRALERVRERVARGVVERPREVAEHPHGQGARRPRHGLVAPRAQPRLLEDGQQQVVVRPAEDPVVQVRQRLGALGVQEGLRGGELEERLVEEPEGPAGGADDEFAHAPLHEQVHVPALLAGVERVVQRDLGDAVAQHVQREPPDRPGQVDAVLLRRPDAVVADDPVAPELVVQVGDVDVVGDHRRRVELEEHAQRQRAQAQRAEGPLARHGRDDPGRHLAGVLRAAAVEAAVRRHRALELAGRAAGRVVAEFDDDPVLRQEGGLVRA